jgi:flagellar hook protein FlgE
MQLTSFYTALTGLNNNSFSLNLIGDNLANMNTTAFKSSTASFSELLAGLSGTGDSGNPIVMGLGTTLNGIQRSNSQGTITATQNPYNVAINQNGYFVVETDSGNGFTRAGNFGKVDGCLVSADGFKVKGYMAKDGVLDAATELTPISINIGMLIPARATTNLAVRANLNSDTNTGDSFSGSGGTFFDSLGGEHNVTLQFKRTGTDSWDWSASVLKDDSGVANTTEIGTGSIDFVNGKPAPGTANGVLNISGLTSGASDMNITFDVWNADGSSNITRSTQLSGISSPTQDGYASSTLSGISIDSAGVIKGGTSSGQSIILAQLALATFPNEDGLQKYKGNTFVTFASSGEPSIGTAGTGGRGTISGSSLEQSNVDMAQEFVNLISAQRAYQANSRVITTSDELYQDSINMKR